MHWHVAGDTSSEPTGVDVTRLANGRVALVLTHLNTEHYVAAHLEPDEAREIGEQLLAMAHATEIGL